ncbi:MAG: hypothetical protein E7053_10605 [Lentisphaerae bacterium]|nr:hypothetical protein [Lentisphaerota bacterium]
MENQQPVVQPVYPAVPPPAPAYAPVPPPAASVPPPAPAYAPVPPPAVPVPPPAPAYAPVPPPACCVSAPHSIPGMTVFFVIQLMISGILFLGSAITKIIYVFNLYISQCDWMKLTRDGRPDGMELDEYMEKIYQLQEINLEYAAVQNIADIAMLVFAVWFTISAVFLIVKMKKVK